MRTVFDLKVTIRVAMDVPDDDEDEEVLSDVFTDVINQMLESEENLHTYKLNSVEQVGTTAWDPTQGPFWDHADAKGV